MYRINIYDIDNKYIHMSDMMANNKPVCSYGFRAPKNETEFNKIIDELEHGGYLYQLFFNNKLHSEGIVDSGSLYEDIMK